MQSFRAQWVADGLVEGELPAYGCMYFPRLVGIDDTSFSRSIAHAACTAPGDFFGAPGHIRIGFAQPADRLRDALNRLTVALRARR